MRALILFLAIASSVFFANYKFSQGVRIIAFSEEEKKSSAIFAFVMMVLIIVLWTVYFTCFSNV